MMSFSSTNISNIYMLIKEFRIVEVLHSAVSPLLFISYSWCMEKDGKVTKSETVQVQNGPMCTDF